MKDTIIGVAVFGCIMTLPVWFWLAYKLGVLLGMSPM